MAIKNTTAEFYQSQGKPLDVRFTAVTTAVMNDDIAPIAYEGLLCYNMQEKMLYQFNGEEFKEFKVEGKSIKSVDFIDNKITIVFDDLSYVQSGNITFEQRVAKVNGSDAANHEIYTATNASVATGKKYDLVMFDELGASLKLISIGDLLNTNEVSFTIDDGTL